EGADGAVRCTVRVGGWAFGAGPPASIGAVRLVAAWAKCWLKSSRMRASRLPALDPPSTTATTWRLSLRIEVTSLKPEARMKPVLMPSTPSTRPSRRLWLLIDSPRNVKERVWKYL